MKAVTAIVAAVLCLAVTLSPAEAKKYKKHYRHYAGKVSPQVRGFMFRPGGHRMGYEADPLLYKNGGYGNYPYHDPRNFWERVESGPFSESTSPSAF